MGVVIAFEPEVVVVEGIVWVQVESEVLVGSVVQYCK